MLKNEHENEGVGCITFVYITSTITYNLIYWFDKDGICGEPFVFLLLFVLDIATDRLHYGQNLEKVEIGKFITTALKSILKLVKLQSLVAKRCKMWKM